MITLPSGQNVREWIATGHTEMRCGFASLALQVQEVLKLNSLDAIFLHSAATADR